MNWLTGETMTSRYAEVYEAWRRDPVGFWAGIASSEIDWSKPWDKAFDQDLGVYGRWFVGAECNTCFNCVDRHAAKRPEATALLNLRAPGPGLKKSQPRRSLEFSIPGTY